MGGRKRNIDSQVDLCPRACIVPPALLFAPERVKPNQHGSLECYGPGPGGVGAKGVGGKQGGGCGVFEFKGWMEE